MHSAPRTDRDRYRRSFYTFPYPTRTALIQLSDGGLFVWSPIALSLMR